MDLFVINRYGANEQNANENDEQTKLRKLLDKVEKNKQKRAKQREKKKEEKLLQRATDTVKTEANKGENGTKDQLPESVENETVDTNTVHNEPQKEISSEPIGFEILSAKHSQKRSKVKRVLPKWLREPAIIKTNLKLNKVRVSGLDKVLRKKLKANGIKYFFPVQAEVIPWVLKANRHAADLFPRDICVSAPTGSGKTLAFVLPVVQALKHHVVRKIRALVILPTQDLATQVFQCFKMYTQNTNLNTLLITGKTSFAMEQNQLLYENVAFGYVSKVDILVCTAGRLVDHMKSTKGFCLKNLEFLIIDEADRVLDSVQHDWLYHLEKHINHDETQGPKVLNLKTLKMPRPPQKLLFSATLSQDPEKLEKLSLFQPKLFTSIMESAETENADSVEQNGNTDSFIGKYTTPNELTEKYIVCSINLKPLVLYEFIKSEKLTKTIVFAHSVETVHRLTILLRGLFKTAMTIEEISSSLDKKRRNNLIDQFSKNSIDILVCTDSLARGIDLPGVQCVISYSAPKYVKTYIHRAGRTARAGEEGLAVTMLHKSQQNKFQELLKQAGKPNLEEVSIDEQGLEELASAYEEALQKLKATISKESSKK